MSLATNAFLFVVIFGIIGMINEGEPVSELTLYLVLFIVPGVMVFTFYANGSFNRVLNSRTTNETHGSEHNQDANI